MTDKGIRFTASVGSHTINADPNSPILYVDSRGLADRRALKNLLNPRRPTSRGAHLKYKYIAHHSQHDGDGPADPTSDHVVIFDRCDDTVLTLQGLLEVIGSPCRVTIVHPTGIVCRNLTFRNIIELTLITGVLEGDASPVGQTIWLNPTGCIRICDGGITSAEPIKTSLTFLSNDITVDGPIACSELCIPGGCGMVSGAASNRRSSPTR